MGVTEQEANIIAAYMDAIRQDTYNNRMNLLKIVENGVKIESSPMMQAQLLQLQQIQSNTYRNMELVGDIKSMFNDVILGNKKIYVNQSNMEKLSIELGIWHARQDFATSGLENGRMIDNATLFDKYKRGIDFCIEHGYPQTSI